MRLEGLDPMTTDRWRTLHNVPGIAAAALLVAAPPLDLVGLTVGRTGIWEAGAHALTVGVVTGIAAAALGFAPYRAVPAHSPARRRSARHAAVALFAIALAALARWVRGHPEVPPDLPIVGAECMAAAVILITSLRARRARRSP
jgi:uncharacterized membrane protein